MDCKYSEHTDSPWFKQKPDGPKTVRCFTPNRDKLPPYRFATVCDTFDLMRPAKEQIIEADYVSIKSCLCNSKCPHYTTDSSDR